MERFRVFLDTAVVKHSIRSRRLLRPQANQPWGGNPVLYELVTEDPTESVVGDELRSEIDLLPRVAGLAMRGELELLWHLESLGEFISILLMPGSGTSPFFEAKVTRVEGPIKYSRIIAGPFLGKTAEQLQLEFLEALSHQRFRELQEVCGVQKASKNYRNQLLDAFHLWTAEEAGATHFLTTDFKLIRIIRANKMSPTRLRIVKPSELLEEIAIRIASS
jgi:predicted nucleic acid-binding protein